MEINFPFISYHIIVVKSIDVVNNFESSEMQKMIKVTKEQAEYIRKNLDDNRIELPVARTMSQKSKRHNYYACEDASIVELINEFNSNLVVTETYGTIG